MKAGSFSESSATCVTGLDEAHWGYQKRHDDAAGNVLVHTRVARQAVLSLSQPLKGPPGKERYAAVKRVLDVILSLMILIIGSPIILLTAIAVRLESKGPVLYAQTRVGKHGKPFTIYKFRSMVCDAEERQKELLHLNEQDGPVFKITHDPRITRVGRLIRKLSIDELPQLFNVLRGDMSLVGPRPPLIREVSQYTPYQMQRLSVTPGLTCYWQISGRSRLSFDEWVQLDLKYIEEAGFVTDFKILILTVPAVLFGRGAC
ncbi:sugar transferase [Oscillospiraceae bacterium WX1]